MSEERPYDGPVPLEHIGEWLRLLEGKQRVEAEDYYFEHVLPVAMEHIEARPEHVKLRQQGCHTLVSLMGFSPETTVMCAGVLRPRRLVIVLSKNTEHSYNRAIAYFLRHKILEPAQVDKVTIPPTDHVAIYNEVRRVLAADMAREGSSPSMFVDVTGGKKIMSATAGVVAWEEELRLCYVENEDYSPLLRRPLPGREAIICLASPSHQRKIMARRNALETYRARDYVRSVQAFGRNKQNRNENRLDRLGEALSRCYVAWVDLNRMALATSLRELRECLDEPRTVDLFRERGVGADSLERQFRSLESVAEGQPVALMATYLELAHLYQGLSRHDFACLLGYRCMEAIVEFGLAQASGGSFRGDDPDFSLLGDADALQEGYLAFSRELDRKPEESLPRKVGFINGLVLLSLARGGTLCAGRPLADIDLVRRMISAASRRNESILAHGTRTLTEADSARMSKEAEFLAELVLGPSLAELLQLRKAFDPFPLDPLDDPRSV